MDSLVLVAGLKIESLVTTFLESKGLVTREAYRQDLACFQKFVFSATKIDSSDFVSTQLSRDESCRP